MLRDDEGEFVSDVEEVKSLLKTAVDLNEQAEFSTAKETVNKAYKIIAALKEIRALTTDEIKLYLNVCHQKFIIFCDKRRNEAGYLFSSQSRKRTKRMLDDMINVYESNVGLSSDEIMAHAYLLRCYLKSTPEANKLNGMKLLDELRDKPVSCQRTISACMFYASLLSYKDQDRMNCIRYADRAFKLLLQCPMADTVKYVIFSHYFNLFKEAKIELEDLTPLFLLGDNIFGHRKPSIAEFDKLYLKMISGINRTNHYSYDFTIYLFEAYVVFMNIYQVEHDEDRIVSMLESLKHNQVQQGDHFHRLSSHPEMIFALLKTVQEQQRELNELKKRVAELEPARSPNLFAKRMKP